MKIAIVASGSRGDVQPYVALGRGLAAAGYAVRVLTSDDFADLVTDAGLTFVSMGVSVESVIQSPQWRQTLEGGSFITIVRRMTAEMKRHAQTLAQNSVGLFDDVDLMLAGAGGMGGPFTIAEQRRIPVIQAYVFPLTPTRTFPSPLTPSLPLGRTLNPLSFQVTRQMLWQTARIADAAVRRELGLPKGSLLGPYRALRRQQAPVLYGYSRHVLPRPNDWDALTHVTGYWFLDAAPTWQPPSDLVDFLNAGDPPVYIGFGSMGNRDPEAVTRLALEALRLSGRRGVLASGWGGLRADNLPDTVQMIASAPHSWLFPRMAAVVHHGGAGTTAAGLRAGVPTIIVPFFGDQPFWGKRTAELGVGPAPIPKRKLTAERLAAAITQATSDTAIIRGAAALGEQIRAEDGIGQAVRFIQEWAGVRIGDVRVLA